MKTFHSLLSIIFLGVASKLLPYDFVAVNGAPMPFVHKYQTRRKAVFARRRRADPVSQTGVWCWARRTCRVKPSTFSSPGLLTSRPAIRVAVDEQEISASLPRSSFRCDIASRAWQVAAAACDKLSIKAFGIQLSLSDHNAHQLSSAAPRPAQAPTPRRTPAPGPTP